MNVYFVGYAIKLGREIFYGRLQKDDILQTPFSRIPMDLLRYLLQGTKIRVYSDVELFRVLASALIYKETVSSPDVDHDPSPVWGDKLSEDSLIKSSNGSATDKLYHASAPL